jgi:hypothetical protein
VFPVRYGLNSYISFRRNLVSEGSNNENTDGSIPCATRGEKRETSTQFSSENFE